MRECRFLDGLAFGLAVGAISVSAFAWIFEADALSTESAKTASVLALATLIAAAIALIGIQRQINSARRSVERVREKKLAASRAVLPLVLSEIIELSRRRQKYIIEPKLYEVSDLPRLSQGAFQTLQECIEFAEGDPKANLEDICRIYQAIEARWRSMIDDNFFEFADFRSLDVWCKSKASHALADWKALQLLAELLFPFARSRSEKVDRAQLRQNTIRELEWIILSDGSLLNEDEWYSLWVEGLESQESFSFVSLSWLDR